MSYSIILQDLGKVGKSNDSCSFNIKIPTDCVSQCRKTALSEIYLSLTENQRSLNNTQLIGKS